MKSIYLIIFVLLSASLANANSMTDIGFNNLTDVNVNLNRNSLHRLNDIKVLPVFPLMPAAPSVKLKDPRKDPNYGKPKNKFVFTEDHLRAIDGLKQFAIQEVDKSINQLRENQICYLDNVNCNKDLMGKSKARLTQFKKSNSIFRRLITARFYLKLDPSQFNTKYDVHFLSNKILRQANLNKLIITDREHRYTKYVIKKIHAQINDHWEVENKKLEDYVRYQQASTRHRKKLVMPQGEITHLGPKRLNLQVQMNKLKKYYLGQITDLVSKEPLLLFIDNDTVNVDSVTAAFDKYISFLQEQKTKIRHYDKENDLVSLIQMYSSLPKERQKLKLEDGNPFTDYLAWNSLIDEVTRVLNNRKKRNNHINMGLMAAGATTFFIPTFPLFGVFITAVWISKGIMNIYKYNKLVENDISFWLSGTQPYRVLIDRQNKITTEAIMIGFFGFSLAPTVSRIGSVDKELFTLKADEVETFMTNIVEYGKARLKWKSKGGIAASNEFEQDIFDVYIRTEGNLSFYIPKVVIDFNDYQILHSGCLISTSCTY